MTRNSAVILICNVILAFLLYATYVSIRCRHLNISVLLSEIYCMYHVTNSTFMAIGLLPYTHAKSWAHLTLFLIRILGWRHGSSVRTLLFDWRTFPDLHLIYGWNVTTSWVKCPQWVNHPANSAFHPSRVHKWVVIHVITWITGVEIIKWQTRAACGCLAARSKSHVCWAQPTA